MKIKENPEDFVVKEISNVKLDKGDYSIFRLKKKNYTTERAVQTIANALKIDRKRIGYAGNKDKVAVTEQNISIKHANKENPFSLFVQASKVIGHGFLAESVFHGMEMVSVGLQVGLAEHEMTDFFQGIGVRERGEVKRITLGIPVDKVDWNALFQRESDGLDLTIGWFNQEINESTIALLIMDHRQKRESFDALDDFFFRFSHRSQIDQHPLFFDAAEHRRASLA